MRNSLCALLSVFLLPAVAPAVDRPEPDAQHRPVFVADRPQEWPQVRAGVWEIAGSWTPRQGRGCGA